MGKRKIEIKRVEECKRNVTFSKRKTGLFSKASTACDKFGSEIAIILFSPAGKPYVFGPVDSLIDQFLLHHHHHQSSSSSCLNPHPNFPNFVSGTNSDACGTTTYHDHIEGGKKRSRSCRDDNGDDLIAEREMKKRKILSTEAVAAEEEEKEGFLLTSCETEEGLMKNGFMGGGADDCCSSLLMSTEAAAVEGDKKEGFLLTSSETEEGLMKNGFMGGGADDCCSSLSPFPPVDSSLVSDDELNETLMGFADYIADHHHHRHEETMFDLLPHQGVCDEDDAFPFSDNWATIDVQDQPLS